MRAAVYKRHLFFLAVLTVVFVLPCTFSNFHLNNPYQLMYRGDADDLQFFRIIRVSELKWSFANSSFGYGGLYWGIMSLLHHLARWLKFSETIEISLLREFSTITLSATSFLFFRVLEKRNPQKLFVNALVAFLPLCFLRINYSAIIIHSHGLLAFLLALSFFLFEVKNKPKWGCFLFGLAIGVKQSGLIYAPLFGFLLYEKFQSDRAFAFETLPLIRKYLVSILLAVVGFYFSVSPKAAVNLNLEDMKASLTTIAYFRDIAVSTKFVQITGQHFLAFANSFIRWPLFLIFFLTGVAGVLASKETWRRNAIIFLSVILAGIYLATRPNLPEQLAAYFVFGCFCIAYVAVSFTNKALGFMALFTLVLVIINIKVPSYNLLALPRIERGFRSHELPRLELAETIFNNFGRPKNVLRWYSIPVYDDLFDPKRTVHVIFDASKINPNFNFDYLFLDKRIKLSDLEGYSKSHTNMDSTFLRKVFAVLLYNNQLLEELKSSGYLGKTQYEIVHSDDEQLVYANSALIKISKK